MISVLFSLLLGFSFPMTALANRPQRAFFSISTRGVLWQLRNPWAAITCRRTEPCLTEIILSLQFFFSRVCFCSHWADEATHHRSRRCPHSVRGHSRSNLLHCRAGKAWREQERKHEKKYLLHILPLKRKLQRYSTCHKKGIYPCDSDNWGPACLLIRNQFLFFSSLGYSSTL